ncbi:hypothetical protein G3A_14535 [Bacillus sp. 17376]|nr:hypothetical protein G3A_14535 [Bacillus sp. 17376]
MTSGIHHITAMVNDEQRNIDFYAGFLGLRLVKKTINYARPEVYHFYWSLKEKNWKTSCQRWRHVFWREIKNETYIQQGESPDKTNIVIASRHRRQ